jgi:hypothetical protein
MADHTTILSQHWTDILPPNPPAPISGWLLLSAVALLFLVVLAVALLWQQRPRQRALRSLRHCRRRLQSLSADTRAIAYHTYQALMQGLALHPANIPTTADPQWLDFYQQLQACVFAGSAPSRDQVADLIRQSRYWLKHYASK